jgi:hypothetical protein
VGNHAGGCRLCRSDRQLYSPRDVAIEKAKRLGSAGAVKRRSKNELTRHPNPCTTRPLHRGIQQPHPK